MSARSRPWASWPRTHSFWWRRTAPALGRGLAPIEAARAAAHRRARPVLMTTVAGIAALVPLALGIGSRATLLQPLAIAVIGGFTTSAPLLLAVLPALLAGSSEGD